MRIRTRQAQRAFFPFPGQTCLLILFCFFLSEVSQNSSLARVVGLQPEQYIKYDSFEEVFCHKKESGARGVTSGVSMHG